MTESQRDIAFLKEEIGLAQELGTLLYTQRVEGVDFGHPNFRSFLSAYRDSTRHIIEQLNPEYDVSQQGMRVVLLEMGPPGAGKTRLRERLDRLQRNFFPILNEEGKIGEANWEEDGEADIIDKGLVKDPTKPMDKKIIDLCNRNFTHNIQKKLGDSVVFHVEAPINSFFSTDRSMGFDAYYEMSHSNRQDPHVEPAKIDHDIVAFSCALIPGPLLHYMMPVYRDDLRDFAKAGDLESAQALARLFNQTVPKHLAHLNKLVTGASSEQIKVLDSERREMIDRFKGGIPISKSAQIRYPFPLPDEKEFKERHMEEAKEVANFLSLPIEEILDYLYYDVAGTGQYYKVVMDLLNSHSKRSFIGYNNPKIDHFGFSNKEAVKDYLKARSLREG